MVTMKKGRALRYLFRADVIIVSVVLAGTWFGLRTPLHRPQTEATNSVGLFVLTKERFVALNAIDQQGFRGSSGLLFMSDDNQRSQQPPIDGKSRTPVREKSIEAAAMNEIWIPGVGGGLPRYPQPIMQLVEPSVNAERYRQYLVSCEMAKARVELAKEELIVCRRPAWRFLFRFREFCAKF
jgi:hypothetical protein